MDFEGKRVLIMGLGLNGSGIASARYTAQRGAIVRVTDLRSAEVLVKELREMRVKVSAGGHESFEAWRSGAHDDLVLATALACWRSKWLVPPVLGGRRLGMFF